MRKRLLLLAFLALAFAHAAKAQFKVGLRVGVNMTQAFVNGGAENRFSSETSPGIYVGPTIEFKVPLLGIGFDISGLYNNKCTYVEEGWGGVSKQSSTNYIDMPINIRWGLSLGKLAGIYANTGPQVSWILDKNLTSFFKQNDYELNKSILSWNVGAGIKFGKHLGIGYTYNITIGSTGKISSTLNGNSQINNDLQNFAIPYDNYKLRNNTHQIHFTYYFF